MSNDVTKRSVLDKISHYLYEANMWICVICFLVQGISIITLVAGRYLFKAAPIWVEQTTLLAMVWIGLLSLSIATRDHGHINVDFINLIVPKSVAKALDVLGHIIVIVYSVIMTIGGIDLVKLTMNVRFSAIPISEAFNFLPLVIAGISCVYASAYEIYLLFRKEDTKE